MCNAEQKYYFKISTTRNETQFFLWKMHFFELAKLTTLTKHWTDWCSDNNHRKCIGKYRQKVIGQKENT